MKKRIDLDQNIIKKNKIPILCHEPTWIKLFGNADNKNIQKAKEELIELLEENKRLDNRVKELQKEKVHAMKMILGISDSINNENKVENVKLLDEYKYKMENINEELDELTFQLEMMPNKIKEANLRLLNATLDYGYKELNNREKVLKEALDEIDVLKARLKELIKIKYDYEEWINATYKFFHGLLGSDTIDKIDEERLG
ncbi:MAG TPA: hypothetical protein VIK77_09000 [Tissierellaceae bacterium]